MQYMQFSGTLVMTVVLAAFVWYPPGGHIPHGRMQTHMLCSLLPCVGPAIVMGRRPVAVYSENRKHGLTEKSSFPGDPYQPQPGARPGSSFGGSAYPPGGVHWPPLA